MHMARDPAVAAPALKKLLRATGVTPGSAFFPCHSDDSPWHNPSVRARDTLAMCELNTDQYFGSQSSAFITLRVLPADPGRSFPTSCVISLSTSLQRMDELAMEDIIVKEWVMKPSSSASSDWIETSIAVKTVYHIAALLGKETATDTRVFLTLRFIGCCDNSDMHRIAAVELLYTLPRPLDQPPRPSTGRTSHEAVEVELTLSPTPVRALNGTLIRPTRSPPGAQLLLSPERVVVSKENVAPRDSHAFATLEAPVPGIQVTARKGTHGNEPEPHASWNEREKEGIRLAEPLKENLNSKLSSSCMPAEYEVVSQRSHASPSRRSVTLPRRTVYLDAEEELESKDGENGDVNDGTRSLSSEGVVEVLTSPCTTRSNSTYRPRPHSHSQSHSRAVAAPVRLVEHSVIMGASFAQQHTAPLLSRAPFVVPDRRDFVPVRSFCTHQPPRGPYTLWGDDGNASVRRIDTGSREDVAEGRRRIRNLHDVPFCDVADDLLCAAKALLEVDRESLCGRSSRATSPSRVVPASVISESKNKERTESKVVSHAEPDELERLFSVEAAEPVPPSAPTPALLQRPRPPLAVERVAPVLSAGAKAPEAPRRWRSIVEDPVEGQMPKGEKHDEPVSQPLADRTKEVNRLPLSQCDKITFSRKRTDKEPAVFHAVEASAVPGLMVEACDMSVESAADSEGPALVVQVDPPMPPPPASREQFVSRAPALPNYSGSSMEIASAAEVYAQPAIGTFLVWKHHVSRNGTAKRILSLQRDEDSVRVALNKMERSKKVARICLRPSDDVEVITSLQAYHSNVIHADRVHAAECCLVVTRGGELVMGVEMQCVGELRLATHILSHVCRVSAR